MEDEWRFVCRLGYHVYKDMWGPYMGNSFTTKHKLNNQHDNNVALTITHAFTRPGHERLYYLGAI